VIKTTLSNRRAVSQIVREYRIMAGTSKAQVTLRAFASALTDAVRSRGRRVSYQSIKNWEDCRHLPDGFFMMRLAKAGRHDWRGSFAKDVLAALYPGSFRPATEIGRRAIATHRDAATLAGKNGNGRTQGGINGNKSS
jgi:hypothetical protein